MPLWNTVKGWWTRNAEHLQCVPFAAPGISVIKPQEHYFRIWLCEMFLAREKSAFQDLYPAVQAEVHLSFGDKPTQPTTRLAAPPQEKVGRGVFDNYALTDLLPFQGGTVELELSLITLKGANVLGDTISLLGKFSKLIPTPIGTALPIAAELTSGLTTLFNGANGQVELGYHTTYASDGGAAEVLRPGYFAVVNATAAKLPPGELRVENSHLYRGSDALTHFDYLLFRIEGREIRDDFPQSIDEPFQEALAAASIGETTKGASLLTAAIAAAYRSPLLTRVDRRRVTDVMKKEYREVSSSGRAAFLRQATDLNSVFTRRADRFDHVRILPEITAKEAFRLR